MEKTNRRLFLRDAGTLTLVSILSGSVLNGCHAIMNRWEKPNFIILFADDMGYGDWLRGGYPTI